MVCGLACFCLLCGNFAHKSATSAKCQTPASNDEKHIVTQLKLHIVDVSPLTLLYSLKDKLKYKVTATSVKVNINVRKKTRLLIFPFAF